ncbi:MAG: GYD domain-containing protein [Candidatus Methylomirabilales bacterium]
MPAPRERPKDKPQTATFFLLFKFTDQGIRTVKQQSQRTRRAYRIVTEAGGTCRFFLTVAGPYDMVSIITGIDDRTLTKLVLSLDSQGTVRTTVLKALDFYTDEYAKFLRELA